MGHGWTSRAMWDLIFTTSVAFIDTFVKLSLSFFTSQLAIILLCGNWKGVKQTPCLGIGIFKSNAVMQMFLFIFQRSKIGQISMGLMGFRMKLSLKIPESKRLSWKT
jgi:hypothetical protein